MRYRTIVYDENNCLGNEFIPSKQPKPPNLVEPGTALCFQIADDPLEMAEHGKCVWQVTRPWFTKRTIRHS